jgi:lysophospholipase L1-like esterase
VIGRTSGFLLQALASALLTVVLLAAIEFGAGFLVAGDAATPIQERDLTGDTVTQTLAWLDINPAPLARDVDLLWRNVPDARKTLLINPQPFGREAYWTIENNSEGFRGPQRHVDGDHNVYRVLCIGDSITFGFNVDQPGAYPRQLQSLLESRYPTRGFEVVNAGVPGWTWLQGLRFLETRGLGVRPDLIVMGHGTNDQFLPAKITDEERFHRLAGPITRAVQSVGLRLAHTNTYRLVERAFPPAPFMPDSPSPGCEAQIRQTGACHRVSVDEIAAAVTEVQRITARAGIDLVLVNLDFTESPAVVGVRRAAERERVPFIDAVDHIRTLRRADEEARAAQLGIAQATVQPSAAPASSSGAKHVILRVLAPDRTAVYGVHGTAYFRPQVTFSEPLYDDGTHGDEKPGDGVYSATIEIPEDVAKIEYLFTRDDVPEFRPLPPLSSTVGDRVLSVPAGGLGPVHVFGVSLLMAERAHPNADGQRVVAQLVASEIDATPSLHRFIGSAAPQAMQPHASQPPM